MAARTVNLSEEAYARLAALKRGGESFSDVVNRLTGKYAILELRGILSRAGAARLRAAKRDLGRRGRRGLDAKAKRMR